MRCFAVLISVGLLAGCQSKSEPPVAGGHARIVTLSPSATEIVAALGAAGDLVGVDDYSDFPASIKALPRVGSFMVPNVETIVRLKPTLVVVDAMRVLMRNGPQGGNIDDTREMNTVVASIDQVAADAWACQLIGQHRDNIPYLKMGHERGLGTMYWEQLKVREV